MRTRTLSVGALVVLAGFLLPSTAQAATATITNESGTDVPLGSPVTITNMAPVLKLTFTPEERRYAIVVTGPDGVTQAASQPCVGTASYRDTVVNYLGNGKYTVAVTTSTDPSDVGCTTSSSTSTSQFTIAANATVNPPSGRILTRRPGQDALLAHEARIGASAGTDTIEVRYARGRPGADGFPGEAAGGIYAATQGTVPLTFNRPGRYAIIARPRLGNGIGPWSAPVFVTVKSPFDLTAAPTFADGTGPRYTLKGNVRAGLKRGTKIQTLIAKGRKGGKFKKLKQIKLRKGGRFKLKFALDKPGRYRIRYRFKGNQTVAGGKVTQTITIKRIKV